MNLFLRSAAIGAISGSRSMLGPALAVPPGAGKVVASTLAVGEMAADKDPRMPDRTEPVPLTGRMISGAVAAAALADRRHRLQAAAAGAAGAVIGTFAFYHLRQLMTTRLGMAGATAGFVEDALAVGSGMLLKRRA
jgi:uncharacterized membrane protein